ncbi:hypothetical protein C8A06_1230 [Microbacteriaceae bacterium MWH-Ta3]|nr:hypothetical protein C8A06_1230 [Microbacteriaceae bacterium MWH-Ta3]
MSNGTDPSTPVGCSDPADLTEATDGSGDIILTCDPVSIDNGDGAYEARTEMRFYADGQTVRKRIIVTNTAADPLVGQVVSIYWDSYFDEETSVSGSTTSGLDDFAANYGTVPATELTADDYFAVTDDRLQNENSPVTVYAFGSAGAAVPQSNNVTDGFVSGGIGNGGDEQYSYYELPSIAPGETVEIVVLNKVFHFDPETTAIGDYNSWQTGTWAAAQLAWADSSLQSGTDVVYAGIENRDAVLNWTPAAAEEPELAETGADQGLVAGAGAIALVAIAAGALTVVARRRSQCA